MQRVYFFIILVIIYLAIDFYVFIVFKSLFNLNSKAKLIFIWIYWGISIFAFAGILLYGRLDDEQFKILRLFLSSFFVILLFGKVFSSVFILIDDIRRGAASLINLLPFRDQPFSHSRSRFMSQAAMVAGAVPITTMTFGIVSGAHDYRVRRKEVYFKNLPKAFDGIRIAQISDIHTGSFFNKTAVEGGVDLLLAEKPDIAFFTGDLVNNKSDEAKPYLDIFKKVKAPLGTFSVMGNHDYGDYSSWSSDSAKQQDVSNLQQMHQYMGYDILLNENRKIRVDGQEIGILGCENWGSGRFSKYGDMSKTYEGVEELPFKILLSHDPSHWDMQIRKEYRDIDLMLSGHTHGFQFGIEIGDFRWSPVKYRYKQWADLYQEENQFLYVNRGYGYIGYPGRIGILPEITILELKKV